MPPQGRFPLAREPSALGVPAASLQTPVAFGGPVH